MTHASYGTVIDVVTPSGWQELPTPDEHSKICNEKTEIRWFQKDPKDYMQTWLVWKLFKKIPENDPRHYNWDTIHAVREVASEFVSKNWLTRKASPQEEEYVAAANEIFDSVEERATVIRGNRCARNALWFGNALIGGCYLSPYVSSIGQDLLAAVPVVTAVALPIYGAFKISCLLRRLELD